MVLGILSVVSEWYLTEWYSEWFNGILSGTYKHLRHWYSERYTIQNTIEEESE